LLAFATFWLPNFLKDRFPRLGSAKVKRILFSQKKKIEFFSQFPYAFNVSNIVANLKSFSRLRIAKVSGFLIRAINFIKKQVNTLQGIYIELTFNTIQIKN
jgi:hypothetical protein